MRPRHLGGLNPPLLVLTPCPAPQARLPHRRPPSPGALRSTAAPGRTPPPAQSGRGTAVPTAPRGGAHRSPAHPLRSSQSSQRGLAFFSANHMGGRKPPLFSTPQRLEWRRRRPIGGRRSGVRSCRRRGRGGTQRSEQSPQRRLQQDGGGGERRGVRGGEADL